MADMKKNLPKLCFSDVLKAVLDSGSERGDSGCDYELGDSDSTCSEYRSLVSQVTQVRKLKAKKKVKRIQSKNNSVTIRKTENKDEILPDGSKRRKLIDTRNKQDQNRDKVSKTKRRVENDQHQGRNKRKKFGGNRDSQNQQFAVVTSFTKAMDKVSRVASKTPVTDDTSGSAAALELSKVALLATPLTDDTTGALEIESGEPRITSRKLITSTGLKHSEKKKIEKLAKQLGYDYCEEFSGQVTHVISASEGSSCNLTMKVMKGIAYGTWLLDFKWIEDSERDGHLLSEEDYELQHCNEYDGSDGIGTFKRARLSAGKKLFAGYEYFVLSLEDSGNDVCNEDVKELIKAQGGKICESWQNLCKTELKPLILTEYSEDEGHKMLICPRHSDLLKKLYVEYGLVAASRYFVYDSLAEFQLRRLGYYTFVEQNWMKERELTLAEIKKSTQFGSVLDNNTLPKRTRQIVKYSEERAGVAEDEASGCLLSDRRCDSADSDHSVYDDMLEEDTYMCTDSDLSDANDPSYIPHESDEHVSCSSDSCYSDIIPDSSWRSLIGQEKGTATADCTQDIDTNPEPEGPATKDGPAEAVDLDAMFQPDAQLNEKSVSQPSKHHTTSPLPGTISTANCTQAVDTNPVPEDPSTEGRPAEVVNVDAMAQSDAQLNEKSASQPSEQTTHPLSGNTCSQCLKKFKRKGALTTHMKTHSTVKEEYHRPSRICPFCDQAHTQLSRHIAKKHKDIPEVAVAYGFPKGSKERNEALAKFRKEGIFKFNKMQAQLQCPKYMAERKQQEDLVCCTKCKGFYGRQLFHRHKSACAGDTAFVPVSFHIDALKVDDDKFSELVLSKFQRDEIGNLCRNEQTIVLVGQKLFQKANKKPDRIMETKRSVMADMRLLARLYQVVQETAQVVSAEDMFLRKNFNHLEHAIEVITKEDDHLKYGVKNHICYLLVATQKIIVAHYLSKDEDKKAEEFEKFIKLFELNKAGIFGDAVYAIHMSRQEKLRVPEQQAEEEEVHQLREYIFKTIEKYSSDFVFFGQHEFITLRDSVCGRMTLFNARRGGEPARLRIQHFKDAMAGRWINSKEVAKLDSVDKTLFNTMQVAYQGGKGDHLVSDLIPDDCLKGLKILTDPETRQKAGVAEGNTYIFANTQGSSFHVLGWDAIFKMCKGAEVKHPELLTATKNRHRISTLYSALDVPESEREYFYKHMGHSKAVNVGTYQYPLPIMAVTKVGKHLQMFDKGTASTANCTLDVDMNPEPEDPSANDRLAEGVDSEAVFQSDAQLNDQSVPQPSECQPTISVDSSFLPDNDENVNEPKTTTAKSGRTYFKWTKKEDAQIKEDFRTWIGIPDGNQLPSKKELLEYIFRKPGRYDYKVLRTKIMNEQRRQQDLVKMSE